MACFALGDWQGACVSSFKALDQFRDELIGVLVVRGICSAIYQVQQLPPKLMDMWLSKFQLIGLIPTLQCQ